MDMRKFTEKSVAAIGKAQSLAKEYGNQEIKQEHLFYALVTAEEGLIGQLLKKMNKDGEGIAKATLSEIEKFPKVSGGELYASRALGDALEEAEKQSKNMGDSFLSVEHLFYGLLDKAEGKLKEIVKNFDFLCPGFVLKHKPGDCFSVRCFCILRIPTTDRLNFCL